MSEQVSNFAAGFDAVRLSVLAAGLAGLLAAGPAASGDAKGSKDHPLVPQRYEGSEIINYERKQFDEYALLVEPAKHYGGIAKNPDSTQSLEGKITAITYRAPAERTTLEVFRNYQAALNEAGFETIFECKNEACGGRNFTHAVVWEYNYLTMGESYSDFRYLAAKLERPEEGDAYVSLYVAMASVGGGANYRRVLTQLNIVELKPMEAKMVVVDAGAMAKEIAKSGSIALYGIYFDFDKASLKPESKPTLDEIAKLLTENPDLKLVVVGHTDNVGKLDYNMALSKRRASAVEEALVKDYGIAGSRLLSWGVGFLAPVASNLTDEGRALNRRVELVER